MQLEGKRLLAEYKLENVKKSNEEYLQAIDEIDELKKEIKQTKAEITKNPKFEKILITCPL